MKKAILLMLLFCSGYFTYAQYSDAEVFKQMNPSSQKNNSLDSLKKLIPFFKDDTTKVILLLKIGNIYMWFYPDSALTYSLQSLKLAQRLNFKTGIIKTYHSLGEALATKGNFSKALEIQFKALHLSEEANNKIQIALSFFWIGCDYYLSGDYQKALGYFFRSELNNELFNQNQELIFAHIGRCYFYLNKRDSALFYLKKAYNLEVLQKNNWYIPYNFLAAINSELGHDSQAIVYYREAINVAVLEGDFKDIYNGMAEVFEKDGMVDSSIHYAKKALATGQNTSIPFGTVEASKLLANIYKNKHLTDSTLKYEEIMLAAKDSFFSQEKLRQIQNISFNEQLQEQEIETEKIQYQNKLKLIVLSIIAVFIIFCIILYIRKRQALHVLNIRNRIARDLHDDVGSALSSISIFSDVINKNLKNSDEQTSSLAVRIGDNARQVIESMSDVIWAIKPSNESVAEILIRMKQLCSNLFESKEIAFRFEADEKVASIKLPMNYRRDIYLIFKEAVNNIVKYADCKNVMIKFIAKDSMLQLFIQDDGKGFNVNSTSGGNGLQNMKTRAAAMQGNIVIESNVQKGTVIELTVPIP